MKASGSLKFLFLSLAVFTVFVLFLPYFMAPVHAQEDSLAIIFNNLGFTNVTLTSVETFPAGTYNATLYAEFAGYNAQNELSYYEVNTSVFNVIFTGPEGGSGYVSPPVNKSFNVDYQFGLSVLSPDGQGGNHRYFTETSRNPDYPEQHFKVYRNLGSPGMFLIGFENLYGGGDRDFNDMVFSLELQYYLDVISPYDTPGGEGWYGNYTTACATLATDTVDYGNGTRRVFTHWSDDSSGTNYATSDPILMDQNKTATANWKTQYYLTLITNPPSVTTPSGEGWYDAGTYAPISTPEFIPGGSRYRFDGWATSNMSEITDPASPSTTVLMDEPKTVTANYVLQYNVTFTQTGLSSDATGTVVTVNGTAKTFGDLPFSMWVDSGDILVYSYANVSSTISGKRYRLDSVTGPTSPITVTADTTITGNYVTQYQVTFDQTGLDATASGTVVTVNGETKTFSDLPYTTWFDSGDSISYSYSDPVSSSVGGKSFKLVDVTGPTSPITVTGSVTVTGNYKVQYQVTFDQTGVGSDFTGTVVVIDSTDYGFADLPVSFWWDAGSSHDFAFQSPLVVTPDSKRYVWASTSGLSALQSGSLVVSASGTITGNYGTQYYLTVTSPYDSPTPSSGWFSDGDEITASITSPWPGVAGVRYVCTGWTGTGSVPASGSTASVTFTINAPSSITWTWKPQYYLTVWSAHGTIGGEGWYDAGDTAYATVSPLTVSGPTGVRYVFTQWSGDASGNTSPSNPITMDGPKTAVANWKTQYKLTVRTDPFGLSPGPTPPTGWYDESADVILTAQTVSGYTFNYWDVDGGLQGSGVNPITVHMDNSHTATAHYQAAAPPPSVGGSALPIKLDLGTSNSLIPQISLASVLSATMAAAIILVGRRKKASKREH